MFVIIKSLESVQPIFFNQKCLFVGIHFSVEFLVKWNGQIESSKSIMFSNKPLELLKSDPISFFGTFHETFWHVVIFVRNNEA